MELQGGPKMGEFCGASVNFRSSGCEGPSGGVGRAKTKENRFTDASKVKKTVSPKN